MAERGLLTADGLTGRAMRDRDPVVALWCAAQLWASGGDVARLLGSARARVRAFAVDQAADDQLGRDTLRGLLADRSGAVRAAARWRWTRRWDDLGQVYRDMLAAGGPPRQVAAALYGLGEDGDGALPAVAVLFLAHPSPAVRRAAARAVGRHGAADDLVGWLAPLLQDESAKVVAEALRYLRGYALPPGVLAGLDTAGTTRSRRIALSIRQRLGPWSRVHADLVAVNGEDLDLARAARTDLLTWLHHDAGTTYGRPDAGQAAQIAALLGTGMLTDKQRREVAFVAGLRLDRG